MANAKNKRPTNDELTELIAMYALAPEASLQLADPSLVSFYKDYNERTLWIDKDISDSLFSEIRTIVQWNRDDEKNKIPVSKRKPIKIYIHSYGGSLDACFALIDVMALSKTPIITVNVNCALSAGCLIFLNGHKRYCLKNSQALIHSGSGSQGGSFEQVVAQTDNYKKMIEMMRDNILSHTKIDQKTLNRWKGKETYLYADDQVKWGLADGILEDISQML